MGLLFNIGKAVWYVLQFVGSILATLTGALLEGTLNLGEWLLQKVIDSFAWMLKKYVDFLLLPVNATLKALGKEPIDPFGNYISPNIPRIRRDAKDVAVATKDGAKDIASAAMQGAKEIGKSAVTKVADKAKDVGKSAAQKLGTSVPSAQKVQEVLGGVGGSATALTGDLFEAGKTALTATAGGLQAAAPVIGDATRSALGQVRSLLPTKGKPTPANSPLANIADSGVQIMAEIARGMVEGTTMMVRAMDDAMNRIMESLSMGMTNLYNAMGGGFELAGQNASQAFSRGVFLEQDLQLAELKQKLTDLLLGSFAGTIKVVDVAGTDTVGTATLSVDSVKSLTDQIIEMKNALVGPLKSIQTNTENTDLNTRAMRGKAQSFALVTQASK